MRPSWSLRQASRGLLALAAFLAACEAGAAGFSLRFHGNGSGDRVKIAIDNPARPVDVGGDFTLEWWMKADLADNTAAACPNTGEIGADGWITGNIVFDRDVFGDGDLGDYGVSLRNGRIVFGVGVGATGQTICGATSVADGAWHHVAVTRKTSSGALVIFVDGVQDATGTGPTGDLSYADGRNTQYPDSDPFLVIGAEKRDTGASYSGWIDEVRICNVIRYTAVTPPTASFGRPLHPFLPDASTVGLYHFDEGSSDTVFDESGAAGGPSNGVRAGPEWSTETAPLAVAGLVALVPVVTGLPTHALDVVSAHDGSGRLFVVHQEGQIRVLAGSQVLATPFLDIGTRVSSGGERGLLSLAFHPDYANNGFFYVYYTRVEDLATPEIELGDIVIARYKATTGNPNVADPNSETIVLVIDHSAACAGCPDPFYHNGGNLAFGPDGYLYISVGDGGAAGDPTQNLTLMRAKVLRIDVNAGPPYAIPADNPYVSGGPGTCNNNCDEIWAYGLRNPWRTSFDRLTGDFSIGDPGAFCREEIDFQPAAEPGGQPNYGGRNYGWSVLEGTHCLDPVTPSNCAFPPDAQCDEFLGGSVLPILEYDHTTGDCAVIGGYVYRGKPVSFLTGQYVFGDLCSGRIWRGIPSEAGSWTRQEMFDTAFSLSSFGADETGGLYVVDYLDPNSGLSSIWRLAPYTFADVAPNAFAWDRIESIFAAGITAGCGANNYCPSSSITRGQMAVFLLRARHGQTFLPPPPTGTVFTDVPADHPFAAWIEALAAEGITGGCAINPLRYCPSDPVTRGQMAVFILRARYGSSYAPGPCDGIFSDVSCGDPLAPWIEDLYGLGVTSGCATNPLRYCPRDAVTRAQMAFFIARAFGLP